MAASRWWNTEDGQRRLADERSNVEQQFPNLEYVEGSDREPPRWTGTVSITTAWGSRETIEVEIVYPSEGYLDGHTLPDVFDAKNRFAAHPGKSLSDRHIENWGADRPHKFCVAFPARGEIVISGPQDFPHFIDAVLVYLDKQFVYDFNGASEWPGADDPHGLAARARMELDRADSNIPNATANQLSAYIGPHIGNHGKTVTLFKPLRNGPCPCQSGIKSKRCHGHAVSLAVDSLHSKLHRIIGDKVSIRIEHRS